MKKFSAVLLSCVLLLSVLSVSAFALNKKETKDNWIIGACFLYDDRGIFLDQETVDMMNEDREGTVTLPYGINGETPKYFFPVIKIFSGESDSGFSSMIPFYGIDISVNHISAGEKRDYRFSVVYDEKLDINSYDSFGYKPDAYIKYCIYSTGGAVFSLNGRELDELNKNKTVYINCRDILNYQCNNFTVYTNHGLAVSSFAKSPNSRKSTTINYMLRATIQEDGQEAYIVDIDPITSQQDEPGFFEQFVQKIIDFFKKILDFLKIRK